MLSEQERKERKRLSDARYYQMNREKFRERSATYYRANKEAIKAKTRAYAITNAHAIRSYMKERYLANHASSLEYRRLYRQANKAATLVRTKARHGRLRNATPSWVTFDDLIPIYKKRGDDQHIDHGIPIKHPLVCGLHVPANLDTISAQHNLCKGNWFMSDEWVYDPVERRFIRMISDIAPDSAFTQRAIATISH